MSKTVDDLIAAYNAAYHSHHDDQHRAGIAAVVRALRDEICKQYGFRKIWDDFDNILGSDAGNEKVAGGPTREDGRRVEQLGATASHAVRSPATAPAPVKELVKRLRAVETRERILGFGGDETLLLFSKEAADALEAMAGEVERLNKLNDELDTAASERLLRAFAAESERDRLKAALVRVQFMSQTAHNERLAAINATAIEALGGDA